MCDNEISYPVRAGYSYREIPVKCGNVDMYGNRALCDQCENDAVASAEHERLLANSSADNVWLGSARYGEM